jgi:hypothetical protein
MTAHGPPAALAETHISVLVSIGDRVFKLKKPVTMASIADASPSAVGIDTSGTSGRSLEQALAVVARATGG